MVLLPLK